jgi:hypothetical protein
LAADRPLAQIRAALTEQGWTGEQPVTVISDGEAALPELVRRATRRDIRHILDWWHILHALDGYLTGQSAWLVNYAERHRAGLRVGTALTEGTANFLVNRRMNKAQQMRWSRRGADLLLQVRCAVYNGTLGSGFGQKFRQGNAPYPPIAIAA